MSEETKKVERNFGVVRVYRPEEITVHDPDFEGGEGPTVEVLVPVSPPFKKKAEGEQWVIDEGDTNTPYIICRELRCVEKKVQKPAYYLG